MSVYKVCRRDVTHLGKVYSAGETFEAELPRGEAWVRAGVLELVEPVEQAADGAPVKKQRRRRRKPAPKQSSEE